ncbi:hypothetical protein LPJ61_002984 [Coemansia biformis]|uniref:Uncharacterized protein n=1 Tax=Coemansia biformis TaxID=1286918 RepID=A0A9W8CZ27_9FUNG|nr:hypothetical protein LPJ61_002984 [Coemansia biformis]
MAARTISKEALFEDRHAYGVPVKASRHPELNQYIADVVAAVKVELEKEGPLGDVLVDIVDGEGRSREAFVVEISTLRGSYERIYDIDLRAALIRISTLAPPPEPEPGNEGPPVLDENSWIRRLDAAGAAGGSARDSPRPRLVALSAADGSELQVQVFALLGRPGAARAEQGAV